MRVDLHRLARQDFVKAIEYYQKRSKLAVVEWIEQFDESLHLIRDYPVAMRQIEPGIRRLVMIQFPYSLVYTIENDSAVILAVVHNSRKSKPWRRRLRAR